LTAKDAQTFQTWRKFGPIQKQSATVAKTLFQNPSEAYNKEKDRKEQGGNEEER
jgi:hypothetical protein